MDVQLWEAGEHASKHKPMGTIIWMPSKSNTFLVLTSSEIIGLTKDEMGVGRECRIDLISFKVYLKVNIWVKKLALGGCNTAVVVLSCQITEAKLELM